MKRSEVLSNLRSNRVLHQELDVSESISVLSVCFTMNRVCRREATNRGATTLVMRESRDSILFGSAQHNGESGACFLASCRMDRLIYYCGL